MSTPLLAAQLLEVQRRWPDATLTPVGDGSFMIGLTVKLIDGWSANEATVRFQVSSGFPMANPQHFWTNLDLKLKSGAPPDCTRLEACPLERESWTRFYYRVASWSPLHDTLMTYVNVIRRRLAILR